MGRRIIPHQQVDSIYELDMDRLFAAGIRYLMIDVDNTLVPTGAGEVPDRVICWMERAKERFSVCLLSNSKRKRITMLGQVLGLPAVYYAMKPTGWGYRRAARKLGVHDPCEVCVIGDQLYTDVWLGRRMGCHTVLVTPCSEVDHFWTKALRRIEEKVLPKHGPRRNKRG